LIFLQKNQNHLSQFPFCGEKRFPNFQRKSVSLQERYAFEPNQSDTNMITIVELSLQKMSAAILLDLQMKYPNAVLRLQTIEADLLHQPMNETQFWAIIAVLNWKILDNDAIIAPAAEVLSHFSLDDIHVFHNILNEKLYALDGRRFAEQLGNNQYAPETGHSFSADSFLYARCCVVANGQSFYERVLKQPMKMPKNYTFESLLYLPRQAWHLKTGQDNYNYYPPIWAETFSNEMGWDGIQSLQKRLFDL
jgi:Protein of unknown function (DUF4240)